MNSDQMKALVQSLMMIGGTVAVSVAHVDPTQVATFAQPIGGLLMAVIGAIWNHKNAS